MKFLCKLFGCKRQVIKTESTWSTSCKRCGCGYGHGKIIKNVYIAKLDEQHPDVKVIYFPEGEQYQIITNGGAGSGGSCNRSDAKFTNEYLEGKKNEK